MTNETARREIESLDYYLQNHTNDYSEESHTAMMMAIKALEQQPCEDCISRAEVLDIINFEDEWLFDANSHNADTKIAFSTIKSKISEMPSVTPKAEALKQTRPKGKWKYTGMGWFVVCNCSECGFQIDADEANNFCPYCGADMRESEHKK